MPGSARRLIKTAAALRDYASLRGHDAYAEGFDAIAAAKNSAEATGHALTIPFGGMGTYGDVWLTPLPGENQQMVNERFACLQSDFLNEREKLAARRNGGEENATAPHQPMPPPPSQRAARALARRAQTAANLALLVLFPIAWFAPLMRAAILPIFGMDEISVISGLQSLWGSDVVLALVVTFLAVFAPVAKVLGLALMDFGLLSPRVLPALHLLGKLAMADVFLLAIYIVLAKGAGLVTVETAWGLYLFTGCILASLALTQRVRA